MECNKDEGIRAKQLAEKKFTEDDIPGAKRLALKAQSLFPGLEGLSQFQETLAVHTSRQKRVNGEVDWYEILGVDPLADNETIKKKYRELALALHPDKNNSVGADGAFKIISEAWSLLSDKDNRDAYNQRRNIRAAYQMAKDGNQPAGPGKSTSKNFTPSSSKPRSPSAQEKSQQDTQASYKKGKGKTSDDFQQDTKTSYQKDAHDDTPASDGKSGHNTFSNGADSTRNVATAENSHSVPSAPREVIHCEFFRGGFNTCEVLCTCTHKYSNKNKNEVLYTYRHTPRKYRNRTELHIDDCGMPFIASEMPPYHSRGEESSTELPRGQKEQVREGGSSREASSVSSAGEPAQDLESTNLNSKRKYVQEVDVAERENMLGKKRTIPEADMAAKKEKEKGDALK